MQVACIIMQFRHGFSKAETRNKPAKPLFYCVWRVLCGVIYIRHNFNFAELERLNVINLPPGQVGNRA